MVVSFKTTSDITLDSHDFSKRQWRKICKALGAQDDDDVLWIEVPADTVELICKPTTKREMEEWSKREQNNDFQKFEGGINNGRFGICS